MVLAGGCLFREKVRGWALFCESLNVSPFSLWKGLPGFDRLQDALQLAEQAAFAPEGMVRWLDDVRPEGEPAEAATATPEMVAAGLERLFRVRVAWWVSPNTLL